MLLPNYSKIKGLHPGILLKRALVLQNIKSAELAREIDEYPQTLSAIIRQKRGMNPKLSIKLGNFFNVSEEYFMLLQAAFEVKKANEQNTVQDNTLLQHVRSSIFWDVDTNDIDWNTHKSYVIERILERGNSNEIAALIKFYSLKTVRAEVNKINNSFFPSFEINVNKYIKNRS